MRPEAYPHRVGPIRLLQTHISWVLLTGDIAYKVKKPVDFGFVNFSTLELRRQLCHEEVRLNRRLSPGIYQGVVAIGGSPERPRLAAGLEAEPSPGPQSHPAESAGPASLEYAVRMAEFPQEALLPAALGRGAVGPEQIDSLAERLARFHAEAAQADPGGPYGTPEAVLEPVQANITSLLEHGDPALAARLLRLRSWIDSSFGTLQQPFAQRLATGRIREGHGDLHLGNMLLRQGRIEVFDCLEFSPALRWIDPISDLAFLVMDLQEHGEQALAYRLLNGWLDQSGDYGGLQLWSWYASYRALVRAKVAALAGQSEPVERYLQLAERLCQPPAAALLLCHGVSGSGKSHSSGLLLGRLGAIRLRSDVERKRLFGQWGVQRQGHPQPDGSASRSGELYSAEVSAELFEQRLPQLAALLLAAGFRVIVDATFLRRSHRQAMAAVAGAAGVPLVILSFPVAAELAEQRLRQRQRLGRDPSDADLDVLRSQWRQAEPLDAEERLLTLAAETGDGSEAIADLAARLESRLGQGS
ncbi:AAA family ATPase [Cyanobium sp. LEGE 06143]|uniref:bifunctional aminoglycoside phosphotransferase/ATP-binding protein n=1 Tax=Cyanobium sp. LEGE 06143 TaxID=945727 RepID=UPI00188160B5|nr:AAA family ATPase [Cyanobium sp. LEGE 06143]MBE9172934.1 AAA family ATPase [Cyanobium sp. LEGE 06143]